MLVILVLAVIGIGNNAFGQKKDSLRQLLASKGTSDTNRVLAYAGMAFEFKNRDVNVDSVFYFANKGIALANKIEYRRGAAVCSLYVGLASALNNDFGQAQLYLNGALEYLEQQPVSKELNEVYHNLGLNYYLQTNMEPALTYFEKSRQTAKALNNNSRLARAYYYLADINNDLGNFTDALQDYLESLELYEKGGKQNQVSNCLTNIATVYAQLKDYAKAREFVNRSLAIGSKSVNPEEVYQNYANIGIVYSMMTDYNAALELFYKGMNLADSNASDYWKLVFLANAAEVYTLTNKSDSALAVYRQMLQWNKKEMEINFTLSAYSGIGRILYSQGRRAAGIEYMLKALAMMKEHGLKRVAMQTAMELSGMYELDGDYKKALEYNRIYNAYSDSIYNDKNDRKLHQLQFDFELEKKQRQIEKLQKNKELQKAHAKNQVLIQWALLAATVLLMIIILVMYRSRLIVKRNTKEILRQKEEIQLQAARLTELNNFKDKTFSVLSHDLRGPINSITAAVQLLNDQVMTPEEYAELKPEINKQLNSLNLLLDNVLLWAKRYMQDDNIANKTKTNLSDIAIQNLLLLTDTAERKHLILESNVTDSIIAWCDAGQMDVVLRNLIMNAIKYTPTGGTITIGAETAGSQVLLSVTDTGVGMDKEQLAGLFAAKSGRNTYGTEGERGIGLGLLLCTEFVKENGGTIAVESEPGKGSKFIVSLPLA